MLQSQVTIAIDNGGGDKSNVWFVFESDHKDLFDLSDELAADGVVHGTRIDVGPLQAGARRETGRSEIVIGVGAVLTITPLKFTLLPAGEAAVQ